MPTTSQPLHTAACTRTSKQVAIPLLAAKPIRCSKLLASSFDLTPYQKNAAEWVPLVIKTNSVDATPTCVTKTSNTSIPIALPAVAATQTKPRPQRKSRKVATPIAPVPLHDRKWITIKEAAALYPKSEQAFRHLIHQSARQARYPDASLPSFGFEKCVLRQPGSRNVYLLVEELDRWMTQGQGGVQ